MSETEARFDSFSELLRSALGGGLNPGEDFLDMFTDDLVFEFPYAPDGVIGLGAMGYQMARHMVLAGIPVSGFDVSAEASSAAAKHGVKIMPSIEELGRNVDVVYIIVQNDQQVRDVVNKHGLLAAMKPGAIICIASSVDHKTSVEIEVGAALKGVGVLDTTLILGQRAADEGRLTVFVGGRAELLEKVRPQLTCFGHKIHHIGVIGTAQVAKTVNNMLLWACVCANYEALSLARRLDVDIPTLINALGDSSGANNSLSRWGESTGKWAEKDLDVTMELAQSIGLAVPLSALVDQLMKGMDRDKMRSLF